MVDWYLRWVDDRMMWGRLCAWMTESVTSVGWEPVTPPQKIEICWVLDRRSFSVRG